jgi:hypothetical protein
METSVPRCHGSEGKTRTYETRLPRVRDLSAIGGEENVSDERMANEGGRKGRTVEALPDIFGELANAWNTGFVATDCLRKSGIQWVRWWRRKKVKEEEENEPRDEVDGESGEEVDGVRFFTADKLVGRFPGCGGSSEGCGAWWRSEAFDDAERVEGDAAKRPLETREEAKRTVKMVKGMWKCRV